MKGKSRESGISCGKRIPLSQRKVSQRTADRGAWDGRVTEKSRVDTERAEGPCLADSVDVEKGHPPKGRPRATKRPLPHRPEQSAGDSRIRALYAEHAEFVRRHLLRRGALLGDIDDLTQRVFWTAYTKLDAIQLGSERAFLRRVAQFELGHLWRTARRRGEVADTEMEYPTTESTRQDELVERRRAHSSASKALARMCGELSELFVWHELEGRTSKEIAEQLNLPLGTVKTRLRKARRILSSRLEAPPSSA